MANKRQRELAKLNTQDERQRAASLRQTRQDLLAALSNQAGLKRLLAIPDEAWAEAEGKQ